MKKFNIYLVVAFTQTNANPDLQEKKVEIRFCPTDEADNWLEEIVGLAGNDENNGDDLCNALRQLGIAVGKKLEEPRRSMAIKVTSPRNSSNFSTEHDSTISHENHELSMEQIRIFNQGLHEGAWHKGTLQV